MQFQITHNFRIWTRSRSHSMFVHSGPLYYYVLVFNVSHNYTTVNIFKMVIQPSKAAKTIYTIFFFRWFCCCLCFVSSSCISTYGIAPLKQRLANVLCVLVFVNKRHTKSHVLLCAFQCAFKPYKHRYYKNKAVKKELHASLAPFFLSITIRVSLSLFYARAFAIV